MRINQYSTADIHCQLFIPIFGSRCGQLPNNYKCNISSQIYSTFMSHLFTTVPQLKKKNTALYEYTDSEEGETLIINVIR